MWDHNDTHMPNLVPTNLTMGHLMTITTLPQIIPAQPGKPVLDNVFELQAFARAIAVDGVWTTDIARATASLFDGIATTWNAEHSTNRFDAVHDALQRGEIPVGGRCLEVGSGTGQITPLLADHFDEVVSADLSTAMLTQAPGSASFRICCDAAQLPLRDHIFDAAVLVDTFCFAHELVRVLKNNGYIVWINLLGQDGPLYVPADDIANALPGNWAGTESAAGWGSWGILSATSPAPSSTPTGTSSE
jgi:SAM-dependent methyltransferase